MTTAGSFVTTPEAIAAGEVKTVVFDDVDMLVAAWRTRPDIVARLLPPPLTPAADPVAVVFIADFKSTNYNPPYTEAGLYLRAMHEGVEGGYCISMLLDDDIAMMIGREMHGYPKKMAALGLDIGPERVHAFIERRGVRIIDIDAALAADACDPMAVMVHLAGPTYTFRFSPAVEGRGMDGPVRLISSTAEAMPRALTPAAAKIVLKPSSVDPWSEIVVEEVIGACFVQGSVSVPRDSGRTIAQVDPARFAPFAYGAWDRPFHNFTPATAAANA